MNAIENTAFARADMMPSGNNQAQSSQVFSPKRIIVHSPNSNWATALAGRFKEFNNLGVGWDGYDGRPIDFHSARFTEQILDQLSRDDLPPPSLVPLSNGRLQFEWHMNGFDIEVEVHAPLDFSCYRFDLPTGVEEEIELSADLLPLRNWLDELSKRAA